MRVRNPLHQTVYQVMAPAYPDRSPAFCSCEDFSRRGLGTCKHLEASWIWLSEHPESAKPIPAPFDGAPLWEAIDRRLTERQAVPLSARSIRAPGLPLVGR
ncbi:MAG TPA: hypothetical protein VGV64_07750 [Thermoplasmata archaeon]|nr:hypothetical protein [Thermoplasmata archaeon]